MGYTKSLTKSMANIGNVIYGALKNERILELVEPFGYDETRIRTEGLELYNKTQAEILDFQIEYGEQFSARDKMYALWKENSETYMQILKLTRVGLKNKPGALHSMRAKGARKRSITGFIDDARILYSNLMSQPDYMSIMNGFGITGTLLNKANEQIKTLENAHIKYLKEKGEAQSQTIKRNEAYDELYAWYSDFRTIVRIALRGSEQMLEGLGIVVKRR